MSQYFENDKSIASNERIIKFEILGKTLNFITDNGVFSKNKVDEGTFAFLKVLAPLSLGKNILDVGCGYGALGLTLAYLHSDIHLTCVDVNTRALALCERNAKKLQLISRVQCLLSDAYQNVTGKFDSIVINPPIRAGKKVIYGMFLGAKDYLIDGGSLYIVIRKSHGAESAANYLESVFGNVNLLKKDKGYRIYQSVK
jgi:16S rRNA (guanine1207-N2)-methyltransferase